MSLAEAGINQYWDFEFYLEAYHAEQRERNLLTEPHFAMSGVGDCVNKLAFGYLKYKELPLTERSKRSYFHGKTFENWIRYKILNNPYGIRWDKYQMELRIDDPPQIGHPEGIIWCDTVTNLINMLNGKPVAINIDKFRPHHLEIKSIAQAKYPNLKYGYTYTCDKGMYQAYPNYIAQQQTYLHELRDYGCDDTFFVYENKNTDHIHGECVPYMEAEFNKWQDRLKSVYELVLRGDLPEREYDDPDNFPCSWENREQKCGFFNYCYKED